MSDCLFCKIIAGEIPSKKVYEDETVLAFLDIAPSKPGHTLLVPKTHVADALADPAVTASLAPAIQTVGRLLLDKLDADGLNVLMNTGEVAGQSVFHLHAHLVPRFADNPGMAALVAPDADIDTDEVLARLSA